MSKYEISVEYGNQEFNAIGSILLVIKLVRRHSLTAKVSVRRLV